MKERIIRYTKNVLDAIWALGLIAPVPFVFLAISYWYDPTMYNEKAVPTIIILGAYGAFSWLHGIIIFNIAPAIRKKINKKRKNRSGMRKR